MMTPSAALPTNPFPGMNPYLEVSYLWPGVHNSIIVGLRNFLSPRLRPEYSVSMQERVQISDEPGTNGGGGGGFRIPDAAVLAVGAPTGATPGGALRFPAPQLDEDNAIAVQLPPTELLREYYLEMRRVSNHEVVAIIELLSPSNKTGSGREAYLVKRAAILYSPTHLVEIDLLRAGPRMPVIGDVPDTHYRILVANARRTDSIAAMYAFGIRDAIPDFVLPLAQDAEGIAVNLNAIVSQVYTDGSYDLDIDYGQDPETPLSDDDLVWIDALLREQGLRGDPNPANQEE